MTGMRLTKIVVAAVVGLLLAIVLAQVGCQPERRSRGVASDAELRSIALAGREALDRRLQKRQGRPSFCNVS